MVEVNEQLLLEKKHFVVATAIVVKEGKYLIAKRAGWEKAFPNRWTVPGGKLEAKDYALNAPHTSAGLWYNTIESLIEREIDEEVGLKIKGIDYVTSLAYIRPDGLPCVIISMYANYDSGEVKLCKALTEYAWVTLEESKKYDLIEGIHEEIEILDKFLSIGKKERWGSKKE